MLYTIGPKESFEKVSLYAMHKLRADVFKNRKGWDIPLIGDMEIDGYDALDPLYMLIHENADSAQVKGCWRLLPTTGPYMLKDTFPQLLCGKNAPCSDKIWELSRFAINSRSDRSMNFSEITFQAIQEIIQYGLDKGLDSYVTVTTVGVERMLARTGINIRRFGPPEDIGVERAVALEIILGEKSRRAISHRR